MERWEEIDGLDDWGGNDDHYAGPSGKFFGDRERRSNMTMQARQQGRAIAPQAAKPPSRMQLGAVQRGRVEKPPTVLLYGTEGVGKSSWAACAPAPIFLDLEDGTARMDVPRFPRPESWSEVLDAIGVLTAEEHEYKTLVIDTLDALEPLCWAHVCAAAKQPDIEAFGYGKGYIAALDQWRVLIAALERLTTRRGVGVIMVAHSWIKPFKNPEGEDFDRYELKLNAKAGGLLKEWSEAVLFARYETLTHRDAKTKRTRGISTGARVVHTVRTAAFDAKNRYDLPEVMPLDWQEFADAMQARQPANAQALIAGIDAMLASADEALERKVRAAVAAANGDASQLARIADKLSAMLKIEQETQT